MRAAWTVDGIYIDRSLGQAARRCALTHEIIHLERGPVSIDPRLAVAEERTVSILAAQRLIPISALIEAALWVSPTSPAELAAELWVDRPTLSIRLRHLSTDERRHIDAALGQLRPWSTDI